MAQKPISYTLKITQFNVVLLIKALNYMGFTVVINIKSHFVLTVMVSKFHQSHYPMDILDFGTLTF